MIETRDKVINNATYSVTQLPARRAIRLKAKLIKMFGASIAQFLDSAESGIYKAVKAIESLSMTLDENQFENLCMELLTGVRKNGMELTPAIIDLEFAGDIASLYQVIWFVIEVNFSNFFQMIGIGFPSSQENSPVTDTKKTFKRT